MLTVPSSGLCFTVDIADVDEQDVAHGVRFFWQKITLMSVCSQIFLPLPERSPAAFLPIKSKGLLQAVFL